MSKADYYDERAAAAPTAEKRQYWKSRADEARGIRAEPRYLKKQTIATRAQIRSATVGERKRRRRVESVIAKSPAMRAALDLLEAAGYLGQWPDLYLLDEDEKRRRLEGIEVDEVAASRRLFVSEELRLIALGRIPRRSESTLQAPANG